MAGEVKVRLGCGAPPKKAGGASLGAPNLLTTAHFQLRLFSRFLSTSRIVRCQPVAPASSAQTTYTYHSMAPGGRGGRGGGGRGGAYGGARGTVSIGGVELNWDLSGLEIQKGPAERFPVSTLCLWSSIAPRSDSRVESICMLMAFARINATATAFVTFTFTVAFAVCVTRTKKRAGRSTPPGTTAYRRRECDCSALLGRARPHSRGTFLHDPERRHEERHEEESQPTCPYRSIVVQPIRRQSDVYIQVQ
jgi:hypothetical protein